MKLPWVSRFSYEEMKEQLCAERDRAIEEKLKVLDMFAYRATGKKVFYPDPEPIVVEEPEGEPENARERALRSLAKRGIVRPTARQITQAMERENASDFAASRATAFAANNDATPAEILAAQEAGRVAAAKTVTT